MNKTLLKAVGMVYRSGNYNANTFEKRCGVNPASYPKYFRITQGGLVVVLQRFVTDYDVHMSGVGRNWSALGVAS